MLALGVFEGKYCNDCRREFPDSRFKGAKNCDSRGPSLNCFGVKSRQPLSVWRDKGVGSSDGRPAKGGFP